jgi:signal transduction histidine kinase
LYKIAGFLEVSPFVQKRLLVTAFESARRVIRTPGASTAGPHNPKERVSIAELLEEIELIAMIDGKEQDIQLSVETGSPDVTVNADHQILAAVVANLVQNAFKFTRRQGHITVRAHPRSRPARLGVHSSRSICREHLRRTDGVRHDRTATLQFGLRPGVVGLRRYARLERSRVYALMTSSCDVLL